MFRYVIVDSLGRSSQVLPIKSESYIDSRKCLLNLLDDGWTPVREIPFHTVNCMMILLEKPEEPEFSTASDSFAERVS